jgi:hypothetical protein
VGEDLMGAVISGGCVFLHIPKTGGNWVVTVLNNLKVLKRKLKEKHADYNRFWILENKLAKKTPFLFCFVRHPVTWYESWYKYMMAPERNFKEWGYRPWHPCARLDGCGDPDFNKYIENIIKVSPGFVTELYSQYTKRCDFIGKQENLINDLLKILRVLHIKHDEYKIKQRAPINISEDIPIVWDKDLLAEIERLEYAAIIRYNYKKINRPCR